MPVAHRPAPSLSGLPRKATGQAEAAAAVLNRGHDFSVHLGTEARGQQRLQLRMGQRPAETGPAERATARDMPAGHGREQCHSQAQRVEIDITGKIRVKDGKHSQLAKVRLPMPSGMALTAKFYGPLYLDIENAQPDVFRITYVSCDRKAFIYHQIKPKWETVVPRLHGSFRAEVPVPGRAGSSRYVHAILYENTCL
ncbi:hypothetical protein J7T55_000946 [Diaporthe amygdali]|uniref:uncharacterized protein n=1 Tax=Phomopsis amygdali TaxID=1214568 RepID=UPI0022FE2A0D|nr:uncharacterized protein J7T55_000946 [Diaporthe amygdali]KAJ0120093.1 hypothetical protein J7T55_000946 [Diaporthe amygdali]